MLGTKVLGGVIGVYAHVKGRLVEGNVVQLIMAIRLGCLEGSVSCLEGCELCTRVFAEALQGCAGAECIKR